MAEKKHEQSGFKVTDRRLFTSEGELRSEVPEGMEAPKAQAPAVTPEAPPMEKAAAPAAEDSTVDREMPTPPSSAEQDAQAAAYRQSYGFLTTISGRTMQACLIPPFGQ